MKKVVAYFISAVLVIAYVFILIKSFDTSNTEKSYDLFYIKKELKYYSSQKEFEEYCENTVINYSDQGNYKNQGEGWDVPETDGTWAIGKKSVFFIYISDPDAKYEIQISAAANEGYNNRLLINGTEIGELPISEQEYKLELDKGLVKGLNKFEIATDEEVLPYNEKDPDSNDSRELNLLVKSVYLKKL